MMRNVIKTCAALSVLVIVACGGETPTPGVTAPAVEAPAAPTTPQTPAELIKAGGKIVNENGADVLSFSGKIIPINETKAGWIGDRSGTAEGEYILVEGWAVDRLKNRTTPLVAVFSNGEFAMAEPPRVAMPSVEEGIQLVGENRGGFQLYVPKAAAFNADGSTKTVRVFALTDDLAALELYYPPKYPFAPTAPENAPAAPATPAVGQ